MPGMSIPMFGDSAYFDLGGEANLGAQMHMPLYLPLFVGANVEYTYSPIRRVTSMSLLDGGLTAGVSYELFRNFDVSAFAGGGYFYGLLNNGGGNGANPYLSGGMGALFYITPNLGIGVQGMYRYFFGLINDVTVGIGTTFRFGAPSGGGVEEYGPGAKPTPLSGKVVGLDASAIDLSDIYPVFYGYYDDHPIGKALLQNNERSDAENITVSVFVKEFMDNPKMTTIPGTLKSGADLNVDLYALFNNSILKNTETTKVSAKITIDYTVDGKPVEKQHVETLRVLDRNALTWDDDRKAAAFVSDKDPTATLFAKNVQAIVKDKAAAQLDPTLLLAMAIHDSLSLYGLTYSLDPIPTFTSNNQVADYIQFPLQTLQYRGGKCSDFSVLYASMFESLGIETAFITIPGHIYVAVALQMGPDDARLFFQHPDDLIFQNGKAWVPIEITLREGGFMKAWELGAKEWRENQAKNTARFYSIPESWKVYPPVGYSGTTADIKIPSDTAISAAYKKEVQGFVDSEMGEQEALLKSEIEKSTNKEKPMNSLAVLYGRFGMYSESEKIFKDILATDEYLPALVNLGNIYFVRGDMDTALSYYQRAYKKAPTNATVLLCVARANHAEENYASAKKAYDELKAQDPALAQRFAYLDLRGEEATRAADAAQLTGVVIWQQ